MVIFRLIFGLLLLGSLMCFALSVASGQRIWRKRGLLLLKWALIAAAGFFAVLVLERLPMLL
ncbi:hypothetical protein [Aquabacterium sp.]|uniref:hypothetical protein n=1 Tax=Aquabacterium sp. TaxID=1872578 RepID=UPI00378522E6